MNRDRLVVVGPLWSLAAGVLLALVGPVRAGDADDLRELIQSQRRQLEEQRRQIDEVSRQLSEIEAKRRQQSAADPPPAGDPKGGPAAADPDAVKKIVADYLKDNPGAGMPSGVQTGYLTGQGFVIRSAPDPAYANWQGEESKIPFDLRIRGRLMLGAYGYKVTDDANHETGAHQQAQDANAHRFADFFQLEAKRINLALEGSAFDPDLRYHLELLGSTRGFGGFQNNKVVQNAGAFDPNASGISSTGGGVSVDHVVGLFEAWVAYDFHGCCCSKGCGPDCPDGTYKYCPTYTLIAGKLKPFYGLEEFLGNRNGQFVEFSMTDLMFDADDDTRLMAAGFQVKAAEDRFFLQAILTNGDDGAFLPNSQADELPGFIAGVWYDLGGAWNGQRKAWDLFGDCLSDLDWSCHPVVRLGGCVDLVPMDRRSLYGDGEQSRYFAMPAGPGGTRLINLLNGDGSTSATTARGAHAVDAFDAYSWTAFAAAKWHGFSLSNEWWFRDLNGFKAAPDGGDTILYTYTDPRTKAPVTALFPDKALFDYGMTLQGGYFLVPKRLEVVARWSWISGESGDVLGDIHQTPTVFNIPSGVPGVATSKGGLTRVQVNPGAFSNFHEADEYTVGFNYYFKRQLLKWQTDFSLYQGGNPVGSPAAASIGTFVPGLDGYGVRTQIQLAF
jgi:hypothetical protein